MSAAVEQSVARWLDALAGSTPTPGGGSVAALAGALAAGLVSMTANLTVGREKFAAVETEMRRVLAEAEAARARLTALIGEDQAAYEAVAAAYRRPRGDAAQKAARTAAIQQALRLATDVPLAIAEQCQHVLALAEPAVRLGNPTLASDAAVAAHLGLAALEGVLLNAEANLASLKDANYVAQARERMAALRAEGRQRRDAALGAFGEQSVAAAP